MESVTCSQSTRLHQTVLCLHRPKINHSRSDSWYLNQHRLLSYAELSCLSQTVTLLAKVIFRELHNQDINAGNAFALDHQGSSLSTKGELSDKTYVEKPIPHRAHLKDINHH